MTDVGAGLLVEVENVSVTLGNNAVLRRATLAVRPGELVTLIGPNGAGKTTLVRVVLGLQKPDSGSVRRRPGLRVGYVPQDFSVDPVLPLDVKRFLSLGRARIAADASKALVEVGAAGLERAQLSALSGGELRRVLLARALLRAPDLLVLDEPVQGVDINGQVDLYELIAELRDRHGFGILMISHDLHLVMAATDQVVCLNQHVCCAGQPETVRHHPEYIALFGTRAAAALALYPHDHDHAHDAAGNVVPLGHDHAHDHGNGAHSVAERRIAEPADG